MSSVSENARVLLIGASRGLGCAIAAEYLERGSQVVATVRGPERTELHKLQGAAGERLEIEHVDINAPEQVQALRDRLGARRFDLLFVSAGVANRREETSADVSNGNLVTTVDAQRGRAGLQYLDYLGQTVAW